MAVPLSFRNWIRRKIYQWEVTFSIYMFTSGEKFVVYSIVFLLCSLTFIAAILYLPHHISILAGRAWYYINGEHVDVAASAREAVKEIASGLLNGTDDVAGTDTVTAVKETVQTMVREL